MDSQKILEVIALYRQEFQALGMKPLPYSHNKPLPLFFRHSPSLEHCHQMLDQMEVFVSEGRLEKTFRWLGFIQGVLWVTRLHTLEELKNHSRPAS